MEINDLKTASMEDLYKAKDEAFKRHVNTIKIHLRDSIEYKQRVSTGVNNKHYIESSNDIKQEQVKRGMIQMSYDFLNLSTKTFNDTLTRFSQDIIQSIDIIEAIDKEITKRLTKPTSVIKPVDISTAN